MATATGTMGEGRFFSRAAWGAALARTTALGACLAFLAACPSEPKGECATDEDCPAGEECRPLRESDEHVCVAPFVPGDAGPDERDPVVIDELSADDEFVPAGGTTTLRWSARNATSCALDGGIGSVPATGEREVTIDDTTRFTLSCQGHEGPAIATVTVSVQVRISTLALSGQELNVGEQVALQWTTVGASACTASAPGLDDYAVPSEDIASGEVTFTPPEGGTASLVCEGVPAAVTEGVPFEVARVASFTATPSTTTAGGTVTLAWTGENVSGCAVEGVTDADPSDDSVEVTVDETTGFTLRCEGFRGVEIEATVTVTVE